MFFTKIKSQRWREQELSRHSAALKAGSRVVNAQSSAPVQEPARKWGGLSPMAADGSPAPQPLEVRPARPEWRAPLCPCHR